MGSGQVAAHIKRWTPDVGIQRKTSDWCSMRTLRFFDK